MTKLEFELDDAIRTEIIKLVHLALADALESLQDPVKSREKIAKTFDVSTGTIDNWVRMGLPRMKVKSMVFFDYHDVVNFLHEHKI